MTKLILSTAYWTGLTFTLNFYREFVKKFPTKKTMFWVNWIYCWKDTENKKDKLYVWNWDRTDADLISFVEEKIFELSNAGIIENFEKYFVEGFDENPGFEIIEIKNPDDYEILNYDWVEWISPKVWLQGKGLILVKGKY